MCQVPRCGRQLYSETPPQLPCSMTVYCSGGYMEGSDVVAVVVMVGKFSEVATEMLVGIKNT